ncbi:peroxiredoxin [Saprospiraceae bacterium]|nr:peroxiredoxin [Saprospiraceae bacterium]HCV49839.1 peroxiredoxin [Saprospirales bacterium]MDA9333203.1 peroxiredoxin [Saprospiraceae bacterium]MDA9358141.1 peroxiredoxin [Saprospiraceae bacterium]MDB4824846.1 peroxiredoxin [Saprospiraceae bacterium]
MPIKVGEKAPLFTLRNSATEEVSLSDYKEKNLVVLFFPLAFTGVCTTELCEIRDSIAEYNNMNAEVMAISVDSPFTLAKFKEEQGYNFPLLSDFNKEVSRAYGSLYEDFVLDMKGVSKRSAFVVDKEGTIKYVEVLENAADIPNFEAVKDVLAEG